MKFLSFLKRKKLATEGASEAEAEPKKVLSMKRELPPWLDLIVKVIAIGMTVYHLYTAAFGMPNWVIHRPTHVAFFMVLGFLIYKGTKKDSKIAFAIDIVCCLLVVAIWAYIMVHFDRIASFIHPISPLFMTDYVVIILLMLFAVELTRRTTGWALIFVAIFFTLQTLFTSYFPGLLGGPSVRPRTYITQMFFSADGFFGICIGVSSTFIFLFIVFGAFLQGTGVGPYFISLATDATRNMRGGAAKCSLLGSALFGSISGSAVANVYATGIFTIPLMQRAGFTARFAAATEAVGSTGGALLPPIMGATAFLVADFVGVPFLYVATAALIPALLYFLSLWFFIDIEARKLGLGAVLGTPRQHSTMYYVKGLYLFLPLLAIVAFLLMGYSTFMAAFYAILATVVVGIIRNPRNMNIKNILNMMDNAGRTAVSIAAPLACASIVVASIHMTGVGLRITTMIMRISGESLPIALLLTTLVSIVVGLGLPTPAAYMIVAIFAPAALVELGVPLLTAHLFVFYYAVLSSITPPVGLAAFAAGAIANESAIKTGLCAMRLGVVAFIIPWIFVYAGELLMMGSPIAIIVAAVTAAIGVYALTAGIQGYCFDRKTGLVLRIALLIGAVMLIVPGFQTDLIGILPLIAAYVLKKRSMQPPLASA
ncbi:MAG: TRAP transporter fused permease subunit [Oscillospiraceae bacterium]|nr:TRAP transporter fused permease subunit [Oscillospiraceae bacterium]